MDELSRQDKGSQSTVNQLTVDRVNSLSDSKDFFGLETASTSGLSHVPSHLVIVPSPLWNAQPRFLPAA